MGLDGPHLSSGSPSEADPNFDIDFFQHESYNILGLGPREEIHHNAGSQGPIALTGFNSTLNQTPESKYSGSGEIVLAIPRSAESLKPLKVVKRKQKKDRPGTMYQAKTWNEEPYSKVFRLEKQKKRSRTSEENVNKRLITKFGPCIPCFQSKTKCSYNAENPDECCARCQRRENSSSLSSYRPPCVRIYISEDIFNTPSASILLLSTDSVLPATRYLTLGSEQLLPPLTLSGAGLQNAIDELTNPRSMCKKLVDMMEFQARKFTKIYSRINGNKSVWCKFSPEQLLSVFGGNIWRLAYTNNSFVYVWRYYQLVYLVLLRLIRPKAVNILLKSFWRGKLPLESLNGLVDMVDMLGFILSIGYTSMEGMFDSEIYGKYFALNPIDLYWRNAFTYNVFTPLSIVVRLAQQRSP
ncbi:hypothetical protein TWF106_006342 [Orbilia oligospora]|uniref:Uncharacterized protein n=1 Tax=Orbilia oligospora TaxID=2813651 RepID=A0A7C8V061_ORBOL|nr:hypothetical protein TWF106_006342 [Orbilia oligospora]